MEMPLRQLAGRQDAYAASPCADAVRAQVERILASPVFIRSEQLARFLRFAVEQALLDEQVRPKEYLIGLEIFNRGADYDPQTDPIVRVEAMRLRRKLREYYDTLGRNDCIVIDIPKGGYMPVFDGPGPALVKSLELQRPAIAVLPFTDRSETHDLEPFCEELTEEITSALGRAYPRVVASAFSSGFKDCRDNIRQIARELAAGLVIYGNARPSHAGVRVRLELVNADDALQLWSAAYEIGRAEKIGGLASEIVTDSMVALQRC